MIKKRKRYTKNERKAFYIGLGYGFAPNTYRNHILAAFDGNDKLESSASRGFAVGRKLSGDK